MSSRTYLSIGDVLSLLRQEFPDVTISKIRFLESQGLVNPERSPSGYRKFHERDVARLRWVLRQQREHFLPLRVIRDRLDREGDAVLEADSDPSASDPEVAGSVTSGHDHDHADDHDDDHGVTGVSQPAAAKSLAASAEHPLTSSDGARRELSSPARSGSLNGPASSRGRDAPVVELHPTSAPAAQTSAGESTGSISTLEKPAARTGFGADTSPSSEPATLGGRPPADFEHVRNGADDQCADDGVAESASRGIRATRSASPAEPTASADSVTSGGSTGPPASLAVPTRANAGHGSAGPRGATTDEPVARAGTGAGTGAGAGAGAGAPGSPSGDEVSARAARPDPRTSPRPSISGVDAGAPPGSGGTAADAARGATTGASLTNEELCRAAGISAETLAELERFGLIDALVVTGVPYYDEDALTVATLAAGLAGFGVEPRHLRLYRNTVDRELGLIEQIITPLLRQRNPEARQRAMSTTTELVRLGETLRRALLQREIRRQLGTS